MNEILQGVYVFFILTVLDFIWGQYIKTVAEASPIKAGLWAIPVYALGGLATIEWVTNPWLLIPACLGAFTGTYITVIFNRKRHNNENV